MKRSNRQPNIVPITAPTIDPTFEFEWRCVSLAGTDTVVGMLSVVTPIEVVGFVVVNTEEPLVNVTTAIPVLVNVDTVEMVDNTSTEPEFPPPPVLPFGNCDAIADTCVVGAAPAGVVDRSFGFAVLAGLPSELL